jgi:hypothetical protein
MCSTIYAQHMLACTHDTSGEFVQMLTSQRNWRWSACLGACCWAASPPASLPLSAEPALLTSSSPSTQAPHRTEHWTSSPFLFDVRSGRARPTLGPVESGRQLQHTAGAAPDTTTRVRCSLLTTTCTDACLLESSIAVHTLAGRRQGWRRAHSFRACRHLAPGRDGRTK